MKKWICLFAVMTLCFVLCSCSTLSNKATLKFRDVDDGVALYRYSGVSTVNELTIPDEENEKPLVEIMDFAVANAEYLETITIGKNLERISPRGFINCVRLCRFVVDPENPYFETDEYGVLYNKGKTRLISFPAACVQDGRYVIPDSVTAIGDYAFYACGEFKNITFGANVEYIGDGAFIKCVKLENFILPETLTTIGADAFSYCDSLTEITVPHSVTKIGDYAFYSQATKIERITIYNSESNITFGNNWQPTKNGMKSGRVAPTFVG